MVLRGWQCDCIILVQQWSGSIKKKIWIIQICLDEINIFFFCWDIFFDSRSSSAEWAEHVAKKMNNANSDRTSNDLVWKIVVSLSMRWNWNVSSVVLICEPNSSYFYFNIKISISKNLHMTKKSSCQVLKILFSVICCIFDQFKVDNN